MFQNRDGHFEHFVTLKVTGNHYCYMIKKVVFLLSKYTVDNKIGVVPCDVPAGPLYLIRLCNIQHLAFPAL